ncbi:hypothetical protein ACFXTH_021024 [Malus domestica]
MTSLPQPVSSLGVVRWSPSYSTFINLNVDASWDVISAEGCVVIVARCALGKFVGAQKMMISASCVAVAEALAVWFGCEFASSLGLHIIIVESDSKENIYALVHDLSFGSWEAYPTLTKILRL